MNKFIRGLEIMAPHYRKGMDTEFFCDAEHDIIYFHVSGKDIPPGFPRGEGTGRVGVSFSE